MASSRVDSPDSSDSAEVGHVASMETLDSYWKLGHDCVVAVQKTSNSRKFNNEQCGYLVDKLQVVVQSASLFLEVLRAQPQVLRSYVDVAKQVETFKLLLALAKQVESFVQGCCKDSWIQSAMTLTNVWEYVASVGFHMELCRVALCMECAATGGLTLNEVEEIHTAEVEVVKKKASADVDTLFEKVILEMPSLSSENKDLACYLIQRFKQVKPIPASGLHISGSPSEGGNGCDGGFLGRLFKWVQPGGQLGRGASGTVNKAIWLGTPVAKKTFHGTENPDFMKEVEVLSPLCHPNVMSVFCSAKNKKSCSIIMELMDGDLYTLMERRLEENNPTPFPILEAVDIMLQIGEGVKYLHNQMVVHRDLKSMNILVKTLRGKDLDGYVLVKVADFGLSKTKEKSVRYSSMTYNVGSSRWMPPEIIKLDTSDTGSSTMTRMQKHPMKCDSYSFGMVCFEILTGDVPYSTIHDLKQVKKLIIQGRRPELPTDCKNCPPMLKELIEKCWSWNPEERPTFTTICSVLKYMKYSLMRSDKYWDMIPQEDEDSKVITKNSKIKRVLITEKSFEGLSRCEWHKVDEDNHLEVCRPNSKNHIGYKVRVNHRQQHIDAGCGSTSTAIEGCDPLNALVPPMVGREDAEYGTEDGIRDLEKPMAVLVKDVYKDKEMKIMDNMIIQSKYLKELIRVLGLVDDTLPYLVRKVERATDSARCKDAIDYLEEMVKYVSGKPLLVDTPSKLAPALAELRYNQASCHERLFLQKELKFFIDTMRNKCSSPDGYSTSFSSASLELCAHHCWSPYCQHDSHGCPEKGDDDDDDMSDSDKYDEELAALGHHKLESPTEFYIKRQIESDGNNLFHLKRAIALLDEALEHEKKAGADVFKVVRVQSFLARTHLLIAESQSRRLLGHPSWPFPGHITPEVLVSNNCHTIGQVREYLNRRGTSPIESFALSYHHYRQCARMFTNHLSSLEKYDYKWVDSIERQKNLYVNLQNMLSMAIVFHRKLHDVLSKMKRPVEDVIQSEAEYVEFLANRVPEALLWSERGRARFLQLQLNRRVQQEAIIPEPSSKDLNEFDFSDEVAWDVIKSSLDACGEGTVFLEYFFEDWSDWGMSGNPLGRVYGVQMASGKVMEPVLMADLTGDPMVLQTLIERFHEAMDPDKEVCKEEVNTDLQKVHELPEDDEKNIREVLEKMYVLLITPDVAEFLKGMQHDHKLVICPSQIFTKVPFAALRNPAELSRNKGYLFQSHTISITPSLRTLKFNTDRYTFLKKMDLMEGAGASVAMGDPRYRNEERRLEKSGAEVESIASLFPSRCEPLKYWEATVANLLERAKLPSERCGSQAFVHIAAHCETDSTDKKPGTKQGILCLTESDCSDIPSSSSMPPVRNDGVLSAENVVKSNIEWCTYMIVLSACGSGKGEIKTEGVLNLPRAFMVAGVPCSIVSQWKVEDDSTAQLMKLFYQSLLKGVDVATALRSTMQEMLDKGSSIKQWAPFMVWGLPTICLPDELLSEDAGITLLRRGKDLIESYRYSDAILPLKKSLELFKAKRSLMVEEGSYAHVWMCLSLLADCEECQYRMALSKEAKCHSSPIPLSFLKYVSRTHLDDLKAQQFRHLASAVQYLNEAIIVGIDRGPQTLQDIYTRYENLTEELNIWKERWTLGSIDIVVEYDLNLSGSSPHMFLRTCIRSQNRQPRFLAKRVKDVERLETAIKMPAHWNSESASFLKNLEYLYEILIEPILEDPILNMTGHQTLMFIPCKVLERVPFALLRDKAQPNGEGYLFQSHTVSNRGRIKR